MSRYYNQLWGRQKEAVSETPASVSPLSGVLDDSLRTESPAADSDSAFLSHCRKLVLAHQPNAPIIFGQEELFPAGVDCYRSLRTKLLRLMTSQGLRSLVISSPNPAEGKTLTTLNLGLTFAKLNNQKILVLDSDLHTGGLTALLGARSEPGLSDVLSGDVAFDSAVLATSVDNLYVVTAGLSSGRSSENFASERWTQFMNWTSKHFSIVLIDAPPILATSDFELIAAATHSTLLVVRALKTSRESLTKAVKQIDSKKVLGTLLNEAGHNRKHKRYGYATGAERQS